MYHNCDYWVINAFYDKTIALVYVYGKAMIISMHGMVMIGQYIVYMIISYVWRTALQPILTYAVQCVGISKTKLKEMDRIQARLLKSSLGISKYCRNTSLLQAMKVQPVSTLSDIYTLDLLSSHMKNNANGRTFYSYLLSHTSGQFLVMII